MIFLVANLIENQLHTEQVLLLVIFLIFLTALLFFSMTLFKKVRRLKKRRQKKIYQDNIDEVLFSFLFSNKEIETILKSESFNSHIHNPLYKRVAIKSIISLHNNYSGNYSTRLEHFYSESGLAQYSMEKLNSEKWKFVVEGIRDLSGMNYVKAYQKIQYLKDHRNSLVQTEALLGMIKLKGLQELFKFRKSSIYLNDWIQSNILYMVKKFNIPAPPDLHELLNSKNESLALLTIRLITHYKLVEHYDALFSFHQHTTNSRLKQEINVGLKKLEQIH